MGIKNNNSVFQFVGIQLGLLLLEILLVSLEVKRNQPHNNMAGLAYIFIPWIHAFVTGVLAILFYLLHHKKLAKLLGYTSLIILLIGFSVCGGMIIFSR